MQAYRARRAGTEALQKRDENTCVDATVLVAIVKRSIAGAKREILAIADRGPAHIARKTRTFGDCSMQKSRLFYLPLSAPDSNPGERARKHLKAATAGRMSITGRAGFKRKVRSSMCQLQNEPGNIISLFPETLARTRSLNIRLFML